LQKAGATGNTPTTNGPTYSISAYAPSEYWPCRGYQMSHWRSARDIVVTVRGDAYRNKGHRGGAAIHEG
jgi:hypothetical protein